MAHQKFHPQTFHLEMDDLIVVAERGRKARTREAALKTFFQLLRELQVSAEYLGGANACAAMGAVREPLAVMLTKDGVEP